MAENSVLQPEVRMAWDAYRKMVRSKTAYFRFLQALDQKYRDGGNPTIAENLQLEKLLKAHDEKVTAFNKAMRKVVDKKARELLLKKISADATARQLH